MSLEPLGHEHLDELWDAAQGADASFTYLRYGPFAHQDDLRHVITELAGRADQPFWAVPPESSGVAQGWLSLCDIYPADGAIEVGSIWFSPGLQRSEGLDRGGVSPDAICDGRVEVSASGLALFHHQ